MVSGISKKILAELQKNLTGVKDEEGEKFIEMLQTSKTVFVAGAGRSGLVAKAFAMRLMHLGFSVHAVGGSVTPPIKKNDLMVVISGSGETSSVRIAVEAAKKHGAKIASLTGSAGSSVARLSDVVVIVPMSVPRAKSQDYIANQLEGITSTLTPLGTVFELSALVLCDSVIAELMDRMGISEEMMRQKHANLE